MTLGEKEEILWRAVDVVAHAGGMEGVFLDVFVEVFDREMM